MIDGGVFAKSIMSLTSMGFQEKEILEWPMDKFSYYSKAAESREAEQRLVFTQDVQAGVLSALTKDGFEKYEKAITKLI